MNWKKLFLPLFLVLFLLSCYEVQEGIVIDANGSGTYSTHMDLAQMIDMMQSFAGDEMNKDGMDKVIDTTFSMRSFTDTAKNLTAEQRELMGNGKIHLQMNLKEKILKLDSDFPFKNYSQLQLLLAGTSGMSGFSNAMKSVFNKTDSNEPDSPKDPEGDFDQIGSVYDAVANDGTLSKKLNRPKFDALMAKPELAQMGEIANSGIEILYTTTIKLPRPVKSVDNAMIKVSDDKKTLHFSYNYLEVFQNPDKFSYTITF